VNLDQIDRKIINVLQGGFPVCDRPFQVAAKDIGIAEADLIARIDKMLKERVLTRFGPLYHAERLGGGLTLAAMRIPEDEFERVADIVNSFPEVAHNYERENEFNMWFVVATDTPERIQQVLNEIEQTSGYVVYNMPKEHEFFVGLRLEV
jgi:DNA-binding Lrp family transcriptional regulator